LDVIGQAQSATTPEYLLYDGHGSTRQLVSGTAGSITIHDDFSYDAYGVMLGGNPAPGSSPATNLLYAGEHFDTDMQQYNLRARWYDQNTGRFNRMDPYAGNNQDPQSLHKYLYCHANPVNGIDPSGQFSIGVVTIGVLIGLVGLLLWGHFRLQSAVRSLPKTVVLRISIDSSTKPSTWNTPAIYNNLREIMAPCFDKIVPYQGVRLVLVEEPIFAGQLGWRVENGVKLEYNGRVDFGPILGLAFSGNGHTTMDTVDITNWAAALGVDWDVCWANFLAHEQLWLNMSGKFDDLGAPAGEIGSNTANSTTHATISENHCRDMIKAMQLKVR